MTEIQTVTVGDNPEVTLEVGTTETQVVEVISGTPGQPGPQGPAGPPGPNAVSSVNGKTGAVVIGATDITSGVFSIDRIPVGVTSSTVAVGNHNHDSTYQAIIPAGTTAQYYRGDKTWQALTKAAVGLGNVDNTSDAAKPISTATQTALNTKVGNTGNESIAGTKTFVNAPVVPDSAFSIAKVANLQTELGSKIPYDGFLTYGNPFGGRRLYLNELHNSLFRAPNRWNVTGTFHRKSDDVQTGAALSLAQLTTLFDGNYETQVQVPLGHYLVVTLTFNPTLPGYPYGYYYVSHYHSSRSVEQSAKVYFNYVPHGGPAWSDLPKAEHMNTAAQQIMRFRNDNYGVEQMQFRVDSPDTGQPAEVTQIEFQPDRIGGQERPYVDKYAANTLYTTLSWRNTHNGPLTATINSEGYMTAVGFIGGGGSLTGLSKAQVGLANVDNTSDAAKPISTATQTALNAKAPTTHTHNDLYYTKAQVDTINPGIWINAARAPYGADSTGVADSRAAIQTAIDAAHAAGGGTVFLPAGAYRIAYTANGGGTGAAGGLQMKDNVTLRGEGIATRLFASGTWTTQGGIVAIGDAVTTRAVRDVAVRELWIKGTSGTSHTTAQNNINGVLFNTLGIETEPDAAHRLLDLTVWDCDRGIAIYGVDDRAVLGQRIRLRHFLRQAVLIGKESGGGGADGYWSDIDASSGNRLPGGTCATIEIRASNVHMVNCKSWYTKRETAFVNSGDYIDGAGFALLAPRITMVGCEAQDNGGHGFVLRVGQQTLTGCVADSNNRSDCISGSALPYECSGFYIGGSASNVTLTSANSFDKRSDLAERFQKHGFALSGAARNIEIRGIAKDNRSSASAEDPMDGMAWVSGTPHESHSILVQSMYNSLRATITGTTNTAVPYVPVIDTRTAAQPARRIELDFPLATANPNLEEVRDERDEIVSWMNEAGQYRFRNPYSTWADSGVRGIIEPGDYIGTANGGGNFMELVNRQIPDGPARKVWGVRWQDGKTIRNGMEMPELFVRQSASDPIPSTTPTNTVVVTLDGEKTANGQIVHTWSSASDTAPVLNGGVTVDTNTTVIDADALKVANDATAAHARFSFTSNDKVSVRFYIKTPSAWPAQAVGIAGLRPTTSTLAASVNMTGTSSPGRLRLISTGGVTAAESPANTMAVNTVYRVEIRYDAARSMAAVALYELGENVPKWNSGMVLNAAYNLPIIRVDLGRLNTTPAVNDFYLDGIEIVTNTFGTIGRHVADTLSPTAQPKPPYAGAVSFWDGTTLWPLVNH